MSCNSKDDPVILADETVASVAVTSFNLRANNSIMSKLDSVFFSIDLDHGVIYNADSLPKGTDISRLSVNISFKESPDLAEIEMTGGKHKQGVVNYRSNSSDTIDFTGRVILTVGRGDLQKTYRLKVNVHNTDPDSLMWAKIENTSLPSRLANPKMQKSVSIPDNQVVCALQESDNTYTIAVSENILNNKWRKAAVQMPDDVDLRSLAFADNHIYILNNSGSLFASDFNPEDPDIKTSWTDTGKVWSVIIGPYNSSIIGLSAQSGTLRHTHYPETSDISDSNAAADFPIADLSNLALVSSKWSTTPTALIAGGLKSDGTISDAVWAFDGHKWVKLTTSTLVQLRGASLVPYYSYRQSSQLWIKHEYPAWLILGGKMANGSNNTRTMISYDNGINWQRGSEQLTLPDFVPALYEADAIVMSTPERADLSDAWTKMSMPAIYRLPKRLTYELDGYNISWQCPYIYLMGGSKNNKELNDLIWRGVLARLTFAPLI